MTLAQKLHWRMQLLLRSGPLGMRERLAAVFKRAPRDGNQLIRHAIRVDSAGREYFKLGGCRLYFDPPYPVRDRATLREGTRIVLAEAFLHREEMFSKHVAPKPGDVVIDGGAHIGTSAMIFADRVAPGGHVYSFEPIMHDAMKQNLAINRIEPVSVIPQGLSDVEGGTEIEVGDYAVDSSIARPPLYDGEARRQTIELTTIDAFVARNDLPRVDLIKLDIEGAEELVINGARETISRFRPKWTIASYHFDFTGELQHPKLLSLLHDLGYRIEEQREDGRGVRIFAW